ncbi:MAG: NAD-dependent epimerase/dehydratase family protein [Candidatus Pacebacteria bacterium]|nr:NAD-dependent epimerase/dehydratase family protein [Candidatus Paceibacterota bacterium]
MSYLDYFQNKTVVLTGAGGFIGSHLTARLLRAGAFVLGVDNFITGQKQNLSEVLENNPHKDNFTLIEADVNQPPEVFLPPELGQDLELDLVLHFASPASPPRYQQFPRLTYLVNSWATHQLLDYLYSTNPKARFVFASTSEVYGDPEIHPQPETYWGNVNPNGPRSCYDEAKRLGETICGVYQRNFEFDVRIARIFNTYGPRMDVMDGRVIPNFLRQAVEGQKMTVYGQGTQTRSYCYVDDLVEGVMRLAGIKNLTGETVNLGNPDEYTVLETAKIIGNLVNGQFDSENDLIFKDLPTDDPTRRKPDISLAKKLLDWQPEVGFEKGLKKTVEYFRRAMSE